MTLEELRVKYQTLADNCEKRGDEYHKQAEDAKQKGNYESASLYYNMATTAYNVATIYTLFVNDLNKVTKN